MIVDANNKKRGVDLFGGRCTRPLTRETTRGGSSLLALAERDDDSGEVRRPIILRCGAAGRYSPCPDARWVPARVELEPARKAADH